MRNRFNRTMEASQEQDSTAAGQERHEELIPGLPTDLAMECLFRVSYKSLSAMRSVCRRWESLVDSHTFHEVRKNRGFVRNCVCLIQEYDAAASSKPSCSSSSPSSSSSCSSSSGAILSKDWELMDFPHLGGGLGAQDRVPQRDSQAGAQNRHGQGQDSQLGLSIFDPIDQSWDWLPPIPSRFLPTGFPLFSQTVFLPNHNTLLLLGGWCPKSYHPHRAVLSYSFTTHSWHRAADMPTARSFFACAVVPRGTHGTDSVLVAGGHDGDKNALRTAEAYDPSTDEWAPLPDMTQERDECRAAVVNGEFCAVSGYTTDSQGQFSCSADVYGAATGTWRCEDRFWLEGICPTGFVSLEGSAFGFQRQDLISRSLASSSSSSWKVIQSLPSDARMVAFAAVSSGSLFVAADNRRFYMLDLSKGSCKPVENAFCGLAQSACSVWV